MTDPAEKFIEFLKTATAPETNHDAHDPKGLRLYGDLSEAPEAVAKRPQFSLTARERSQDGRYRMTAQALATKFREPISKVLKHHRTAETNSAVFTTPPTTKIAHRLRYDLKEQLRRHGIT